MTDPEEERIAHEAREDERWRSELTNRVRNLELGHEKGFKSVWMALIWVGGAVWAGVVYMAARFAETLGGR